MNTMVKQTFMNGIHKEITYKIAEQPRLELAATVELATRIWNNSNQRSNQNLTLFPQQTLEQRNNYASKNEIPKVILPRNTPRSRTPRQDPEGYLRDEMFTAAEPRQRRNEVEYNDELEEVIGRMKRLEAHLFQTRRQEAPRRSIDYRRPL